MQECSAKTLDQLHLFACNFEQYNTIQQFIDTPLVGLFSDNATKRKKKLIKIREVVNNSIKWKECGEQSNLNIPI